MIAAHKQSQFPNRSFYDPFLTRPSLRLIGVSETDSQDSALPVATISVEQAASRLGVCRATICRMLRENRLHGFKFQDEWQVRDASLSSNQKVHGTSNTLSVEESARRLHRSATTMYEKLRHGAIHALKYKGTWHVAPEAVHAAELNMN